MKTEDFHYPFTWAERRPYLNRQLFYVPDYYAKHGEFSLPLWGEIFGNSHPVHIEYCSGNGEWILDRAAENPEINWVAVEQKFDRVRKIFKKKVSRELGNLLVVAGEALTFSREYLSRATLDTIYVNFPDPCPKDRHAKHRIIQSPFLEEMSRIMKGGGEMLLVTDDFPYHEQMRKVVGGFPEWTQKGAPASLDEYGSSYFDRLWRSLGREIHCLHYVRGA